MKQIQCAHCKQLADVGKFCNHCQARMPTGTSKGLKIAAGVAAGVMGMILWGAVLSIINTTPEAKSELDAKVDAILAENREAKAKANSAPISTPASKQNWSYSTSVDSMTGKGTDFAETDSTNTVNFGFPYGGEQHASLILRQHPRHGASVILGIEKGQFLCGVTGCGVMVRFNDKPARRFSASQPADYSSTALFMKNPSSLKRGRRKRFELKRGSTPKAVAYSN